MPFTSDEIRWELACGRDSDGRCHGWFGIHIHAAALGKLGLHPDQPTATTTGPPPPNWWHAAAELDARSRF